ncbi:hypothetical protein G7046_g6020 [Stylonectria norvegica]|nr:hypothetical protein G7046_g6020 [Stylonectria norvegica]
MTPADSALVRSSDLLYPNLQIINALMREFSCSEQEAISMLQSDDANISEGQKHYAYFVQLFKRNQENKGTPHSSTSDPKQTEGQKRNIAPADDHFLGRGGLPPSKSLFAPHNAGVGPIPYVFHGVEDLSSKTKATGDDSGAPFSDWDFILPQFPPPATLVPEIGAAVNLEALVRVIQHGATIKGLGDYVEHLEYVDSYDRDYLRQSMNKAVEGFPPIFYAVETNNIEFVQLFLKYGADASAVHSPSQTPLLAYAIVNGEQARKDTTAMVLTLLRYAASPSAIPSGVFTPYMQDPSTTYKLKDGKKADVTDTAKWGTDKAIRILNQAANLTQRYWLYQVSRMKSPTARKRQVAQIRDAEGLLDIPYFLVGQTIAKELLMQRLLTHLMIGSKRPLVLCFAGPSGHGKTELARQLGHLMSLDLEVVDCTTFSREFELFGGRAPYQGYERGSPLNNFLAAHAGKKSIVFLDEFEKTSTEIHNSLLVPFDTGDYQDRRNRGKVDCSNTIWILATNALDETIFDFCDSNDAILGDDVAEKSKLVRKLSKELQHVFFQRFGAPLTGRISDFVPFVPFSEGEQAVITHKTLLDLASKFRLPVCLDKGPAERLIGDIRLRIEKDATVCSMLAEDHYHRKLGARSLRAAGQKIERMVADDYLDVDEKIQEDRGLQDFVVGVVGTEIVGRAGKRNAKVVDVDFDMEQSQ